MSKPTQITQFFKTVLKTLTNIWKVIAQFIGSLILVITLLVLIIVIAVGESSQESGSAKVIQAGNDQQKVAVIRLNGEIMQLDDQASPFSVNPFIITPQKTHKVFKQVAADDSVKAVLLVINSPGGSVVASEEIYQQIQELKQIKPVVANFGEVAASGGYYLACAADKIVASPATLTGSIGVIMFSPNLSGLYEKLGVEIATYKSGKFKDIGSPNRAETEQEQALLQEIIDDSYQLFVDRIVAGRALDRDQVLALADGRIYSGVQAQENGLVDELGGFNQAVLATVALANLSEPTVVEYRLGGWWSELFSSQVSRSLFPAALNNLLTPNRQGLYYLWE